MRQKDARLRIPIERDYVHSIGLAMIAFARLEWSVVWWCEKINPGYIATVGEKTAGKIGKDFSELVEQSKYDDLKNLAAAYEALTRRRNDLVHANPGTHADGAQLLFRHSQPWLNSMIDDLADEFAQLGSELVDRWHSTSMD